MKTILNNACIAIAWLYAGGVVLWFALHGWLGDAVWWLALLNAFAPFFFLPLVLILPACFVCRRRSFWISVVPPAIIFLSMYGHLFLPAQHTPPATGEKPLTIMSFNIWGGSRSRETALVIPDNASPDVVAIQELTPHMAQVLIEEVGDVYPHRVFSTGTRDRGMGILSRHPLAELDSNRLSDPGWQIQVVQVEANGRTFTLYNVHLRGSNVLVYLQAGDSIADEVQAGFQTRKTLARRLTADAAARPGPVVVAGDFNSTGQSDVYAILAGDLTDAHQAVGWGFGHTFPAYAGSFRGIPIIPGQMRLDMIFYSQEFVALGSSVGPAHGESDHLPVLARLAWRR